MVGDHEQSTPLHFSVGYGNTNFVKALIEKQANVNAINGDNNTPLDIALFHQNEGCKMEEIIHELRTAGAKESAYFWTRDKLRALKSKLCDREIKFLMLEDYVLDQDINHVNDNGINLLHKLSYIINDEQVIDEILSWRFQIDAIDTYNKNTSLDYAVEGKNTNFVKALIEKQANVNAINNHKHTPLDVALRSITLINENIKELEQQMNKNNAINNQNQGSPDVTLLHKQAVMETMKKNMDEIIEALKAKGAKTYNEIIKDSITSHEFFLDCNPARRRIATA